MGRMGRTVMAAVVLAAGLGSARPARAEFLEDAGWGMLTVLSNVVYMPAKVVYATVGGLTGGLAFALTGGSLDTAETVWVTAMGGTYAVTPAMLRGEETIAFAGTPTPEPATDTANDGNAVGTLQEQQIGSASASGN